MLPPVPELLDTLQTRLHAALAARGWTRPWLVGIHRGGAWLAQALAQRWPEAGPVGTLDISFHRDDYDRRGLHPVVRASELPRAVDDAQIVLVDDILQTGRTIRAAINALFEFGRPQGVLLAVLVDRGGRELPIQADACALQLAPDPTRALKLRHDPCATPALWLEWEEVRA